MRILCKAASPCTQGGPCQGLGHRMAVPRTRDNIRAPCVCCSQPSRGLSTGENKIGTFLCIPSAGRSWKRQHPKASGRCWDLQNTPKNICIPTPLCGTLAAQWELPQRTTQSGPLSPRGVREAKHRTQQAPSTSHGIVSVAHQHGVRVPGPPRPHPFPLSTSNHHLSNRHLLGEKMPEPLQLIISY